VIGTGTGAAIAFFLANSELSDSSNNLADVEALSGGRSSVARGLSSACPVDTGRVEVGNLAGSVAAGAIGATVAIFFQCVMPDRR
jgi:hypothetical protein